MKQKYVIALYIRLSVEDFKTESLSIPNQKLLLLEKAMSLQEWDNSEVLEFVDNGHTGTNFERPAVQELLTMVQAGKIDCIIVKDLSRFGRNSIETGYFIERVFPLYHTRFISVSDDFDEDKLHSIQDSKRQLYEQYALGEIDLETYRERKAVYDAELVQAKNVHAAITAQTKQIQSDYEARLKQREIVQEVDSAGTLTQALIDRLINKVYIFPGDRIEIEYVTQDFLATAEP